MAKRFNHLARGAFTREATWSSTDVANLIALVEIEKLTWEDCGEELGRTKTSCKIRYRMTGRGGGPEDKHNYPKRDAAREKAIAERDARHAAVLTRNDAARLRGDLTFLIGDFPPPGMSALDKLRAGQ